MPYQVLLPFCFNIWQNLINHSGRIVSNFMEHREETMCLEMPGINSKKYSENGRDQINWLAQNRLVKAMPLFL